MDVQLLSVDEAASALHVCPRTIRRAIAAGHLAKVQVGRVIRIAVDDLKLYVQARRSQKPAPISRHKW